MYAPAVLAQNGNLKGSVQDSMGRPLPSVSVFIANTRYVSITDSNGRYRFWNIAPGDYHIVISAMGYVSVVKKVTIKEHESSILDFKLKHKAAGHVIEVTISGQGNVEGIRHMRETGDAIIYTGMKNEVLIPDSLNANIAQNNPREILGRIPGANFAETEGAGFPTNGIGLRGLNPNQSIEINTRQNGYNISANLYGYPDCYYLPPMEAIERIEVVRGAASLQFGPQFGGVINYVIKDGSKTAPVEIFTAQTGGAFGLFNSFKSLGGKYGKWNYYSYIQYKYTNGWRHNSEVQQLLGFAKVQYQATDKWKLGLEYSILRNKIHMPGGLTDAQYEADPHGSFRTRNWLKSPWNIVTFSSSYRLSASTLFTFQSTLNISDRSIVWRDEKGGIPSMDSMNAISKQYSARDVEHETFISSTNELRMLKTYTIKGVSQTLGAGLSCFSGYMKREGGGPGSTQADFDLKLYGGPYTYKLNFNSQNIAVYIENVFHLNKRLSIIPGYRLEYLSSTMHGYQTDTISVLATRSQARYTPLGGIGLQYITSRTSNVYANLSQAYRPTDYSSHTLIGVSSRIDPYLHDSHGYNADIGWRGKLKSYLNFDIGAFYLVCNQHIGIETLFDQNNKPYTNRSNTGNSVNQGLECYVEMNPLKMLGQNPAWGSISFFDAFAYIHARYVSGIYQGNTVEFAPGIINRLGITYSIRRISSTFLISNTARAFADANNTLRSEDASVGLIPAYRVMDWAISVRFSKYTLRAGLNNVANARYFSTRSDEYPGPGIIPAIGRSFYLGIGANL